MPDVIRCQRRAVLIAGIAALTGVLFVLAPWLRTQWFRLPGLFAWLRQGAEHPEWSLRAHSRCGNAPFSMPTDGYIGFLWGDAFRPWHRHQGLDIFSGTEPGSAAVYAAYPGFLTRLPDWKSAVIMRVPSDPLTPGRQIWLYYTHMADQKGNSYISERFPPGTRNIFVEEGTLLGYQGNYSGDPNNPVGVHLHFSIVLDDGDGNYLNELDIRNTLDPSQYFGMPLKAAGNWNQVPACQDSLVQSRAVQTGKAAK